ERYDGQLRDLLKVDPTGKSTQEKMALLRAYREEQYHKLQDAAYARRGWDSDGVPTLETVRAEGIDFPEVVDLIAKHAHSA
ncbi:MAG TPA: aldehyde ferredoxin oxidoreductase C-terminal domain-containing protein, partial [Candidatus Cryosericum sp.]|nr:aldehyde ferredoxin oxidoreductase C-terminal domain-containing protein [Candidatus Cryosericum sp.]